MKIHVRLRPTTLAFILLASLLMVSVALAASVTIDTFDVADQLLEATSTTPIVDDFVSNPAIPGTERDARVQFLTGTSTVRLMMGPFQGGELVFSVGSPNTGRGWVIYDGVDGNAALDPDGLCTNPPSGCLDLTGGGTNDSLHFEVVYNNVPFLVEFRVYSGSTTNYSYYQLNLPGSIGLSEHVDFLIPFSTFSDQGSGADFANVGAFEIYLDGSLQPGAKLNLDLFRADSWRDFGDAPASYGTVTHIPNGVRLGASEDAEETQQSSTNANGDDANQAPPDDEDGVVRTPGVNWSVAGGGSVNVTLNGCTNFPCYLNGWIDWDQNGAFDVDEQIFTDEPLTSIGSHTLPLPVPVAPGNNTYYARFRLCTSAGECSSADGEAGSGEVEDYRWSFGPTAVTLSNFTAQSGSPLQFMLILSIAAAGMLVGLSIFTWVRAHQKA